MENSMFVDKFYEMDPQFEDLLPDGSYLKEGMVVLLEDSMFRADSERVEANPYEAEKMREANRWCRVTHLEIGNRYDPNPLIKFIAVYGDGVKKKRVYNVSFAWIVKIDSIPQEES